MRKFGEKHKDLRNTGVFCEGSANYGNSNMMGGFDNGLEELEWRYNNRKNPHIFRDTLKRIMQTQPLEYKKLVA